MQIKHTAAEKRAIERAYLALLNMARQSSTAGRRIEEAYKAERREVSSMPAAQAIIVRVATDDWRSRAGDMFPYRDSLILVATAAAECQRLSSPATWRRFKRLARAAVEAQADASDRALDEVMGR